MVAEVRRRSDAGTELPADARERLEAHSGVDLSQVRVHTDGPAESLTRELSADAFTVGTDIFVAPRAYAPDTVSGQALLAHEVTHVAQQTGGEVVQRATATVEAPDNTAEAGDKREELAKQQAEQAQQAQQGGSAADGAAGAGGPAPAGTPPVGGVGGEIASAPP